MKILTGTLGNLLAHLSGLNADIKFLHLGNEKAFLVANFAQSLRNAHAAYFTRDPQTGSKGEQLIQAHIDFPFPLIRACKIA